MHGHGGDRLGFFQATLGLRTRGVPHFHKSRTARDASVAACSPTELWMDLVDLAAPPPADNFASAQQQDTVRSSTTSGSVPCLSRPGCPGGLGGLRGFTVVIDLQSPGLSFGSLDKAYLANQTEYAIIRLLVARRCLLLRNFILVGV